MSGSHGNGRIAFSAGKGTREETGPERIELAPSIIVPDIEKCLPDARRQKESKRRASGRKGRRTGFYLWTALGLPVAALFLATYVIGSKGLLVGEPGNPLRPVALSAIAPVAVFLLTYWRSRALRDFLALQSPVLLTALQSWRVIGFAFLPLYAFGHLPALFAWPAGIGDLLVGLAAPFLAWQVLKSPSFSRTRRFLAFHLLGLFDFALAIAAAAMSSGVVPRLVPGGIGSAAMEVWPMNIFPGFLVPLFIILHLSVLLPLLARKETRPTGQVQDFARGAT